MKVIETLEHLDREPGPLSLAAGFFDGVHRGHAKVMTATREHAAGQQGAAWVLTFEPHPMRILNPAAAPSLLTSLNHKLRLIERQGMDGCVVCPFTRDLADLEPEPFIDRLVAAAPTMTDLFVGRNWRFGRHRKGDTSLLARLAARLGFNLKIIGPASRTSETISSTRIRAEVLRGNLRETAAMLGRPFSILGTVTQGQQQGRRIGYPTANVDPHNEVLPPYGIYAIHGILDDTVYDGVLSYGVRPTFHAEGAAPVLEAHFFDLNRDLYGKDLELFFVSRLRDEERYDSVESLREQIGRDVVEARRVLAERSQRDLLQAPGP